MPLVLLSLLPALLPKDEFQIYPQEVILAKNWVDIQLTNSRVNDFFTIWLIDSGVVQRSLDFFHKTLLQDSQMMR